MVAVEVTMMVVVPGYTYYLYIFLQRRDEEAEEQNKKTARKITIIMKIVLHNGV